MPVPSTDNSRSIRRLHRLLLALLIVSLGPVDPAIATTGINSASDEPAAQDVTIKIQRITAIAQLCGTDTAAARTASDLGNLLSQSVSASGGPASRELRSAALADALKRRQPRRNALRQDKWIERPPVEAGIPGISTARVLAFRREMFRTDI